MNRAFTIEEHGAFRNLLDAMSRPGTVHGLSDSVADRDGALALLARTLLDAEVSVAGAGADDEPSVRAMAHASGCRLAALPEADFVVAGGGSSAGAVSRVRMGTPDWPDSSATVVYLVDRVAQEGGDTVWTGPGIPGERSPRIDGFDPAEWERLREANSGYPIGIDCVFLDASGRILAMPRSTRVRGGSR